LHPSDDTHQVIEACDQPLNATGARDRSKVSLSKPDGPVMFYEEEEDQWSSPTDITFGFEINPEFLWNSNNQNVQMPTNLSFQVSSLFLNSILIILIRELNLECKNLVKFVK